MNVDFKPVSDISNNETPCGACGARHREPTMYPNLLRSFDAFQSDAKARSPQEKICSECRKAREAAEAEYAGKISALLADGKELSVEDMAAMAAYNEQCSAEYERIAAEHEAKSKALRTA